MTKASYLVRRLRRDMRVCGFKGTLVVLFGIVMTFVPVEVVTQIQHGVKFSDAVLDGWTHIAAACVGYVMMLLAAVQTGAVRRAKAYLDWHIASRCREENDKLAQLKLGYEEQLRAKVIEARRGIAEERKKDGDGWKK